MDRERELPQLVGVLLEEHAELTLAEVCRACAVQDERIVELVEEGVLAPAGPEPRLWRFTYVHVRRARVALRLQQDLGLNPAGAALALELLEEVEALRARLERSGGEPPGSEG
jgi:chaperone modulatory protein CbpM